MYTGGRRKGGLSCSIKRSRNLPDACKGGGLHGNPPMKFTFSGVSANNLTKYSDEKFYSETLSREEEMRRLILNKESRKINVP